MGRWQNKYVIGLTGNIGVGKSVVRQMLQHCGAYTIDADQLAHQVLLPGAPAYKPVIDTFGKFIVGADGKIDRTKLGKLVFGDAEALKKLESITHPIIRQGINVLVNRSQQRVVVIEAIKLLEGELADAVDAIWVVDAKPQTQYKRLIEKRKMSEEEAKQRMLAQGRQDEKLKRAHVVINNDGSVEDTWKQVQAHWNDIRAKLTQAQSGAPAKPTAAPQAKTAPTPAPAAADSVEAQDTLTNETRTVDVSGIVVKRGTPSNAQAIADFMSAVSGKKVERMDIMLAFGQKSFLIAQDQGGQVLAVLGWTVENLVTRMDDFFISPSANLAATVQALIVAVEAASKELQSEVGFLFLPPSTAPSVQSSFNQGGYANIKLEDIKIPVWREAVDEVVRTKPTLVLWKQLRKDRVLQPI
ncbi:MAG: dephospho-CoA kinase [Anaerolineae bacterium]|nr:dephospho-CoA kinase [Anaerolineae bacterium]MDW8172898.1 dephospho-CoA kinase [Anaerolineae bacterium]